MESSSPPLPPISPSSLAPHSPPQQEQALPSYSPSNSFSQPSYSPDSHAFANPEAVVRSPSASDPFAHIMIPSSPPSDQPLPNYPPSYSLPSSSPALSPAGSASPSLANQLAPIQIPSPQAIPSSHGALSMDNSFSNAPPTSANSDFDIFSRPDPSASVSPIQPEVQIPSFANPPDGSYSNASSGFNSVNASGFNSEISSSFNSINSINSSASASNNNDIYAPVHIQIEPTPPSQAGLQSMPYSASSQIYIPPPVASGQGSDISVEPMDQQHNQDWVFIPPPSNVSPGPVAMASHNLNSLSLSISGVPSPSAISAPSSASSAHSPNLGALSFGSGLQSPSDAVVPPLALQSRSSSSSSSISSQRSASGSIPSLPISASIRSQSNLPPLEPPPPKEFPPIRLGNNHPLLTRSLFESLGDLYSLIVAADHIEKAFVRDSIPEDVYTQIINKLITQYKTIRDSLNSTQSHAHSYSEIRKILIKNPTDVPTESGPNAVLDLFAVDFKLSECNSAILRFKAGIPASVGTYNAASQGQSNSKEAVMMIVQNFITAMDSIKLMTRAVDELHPHLLSLLSSVQAIPGPRLADNASPSSVHSYHLTKVENHIKACLELLHGKAAYDQITDDQARQMSFELEKAYGEFHSFVKSG